MQTNNSVKSVEPNKDKETINNICTQCLFKRDTVFRAFVEVMVYQLSV